MPPRPTRSDGATSRPDAGGGGALLGRAAELERVTEAIRADRPVVVVGEAGIGKTTLVRAAAAAAGRRTHEGGGFATLARHGYLAIGRALGRAVAGDPVLVAAAVERAVGPDVLFVDDFQWVDPASREVVGLLVGRIAVVVAIRDGDAVAEALDGLEPRGALVVRLAGLSDADATGLARRLRPDVPEARLRRILERAGGNPLVIEELAAGGTTSSTLARAIVSQLATLAPPEREALELLALADGPLAARPLGHAVAPLRERGLVLAVPDGLLIRHSLIAEAIAGGIGAERRAGLHARLARIRTDPVDRARHLAAAGRRSEAFAIAREALGSTTEPRARADLLALAADTSDEDAAGWAVRAARQLHAVGRPLEAIALLDAAPPPTNDDDRAFAAATRAGALDHEGREAEASRTLEQARDLRPRPGGPAALILALVESVVLVNQGRLDEAIAVAERVPRPDDPLDRIRLDGQLAALRLYAGQSDRLEPLEAAVAAAIAAGDGGTASARAMDLYYMTLALRGAPAAHEAAGVLATRLEALGYHTRASELRAERAQAAILAGRLEETVVDVDSMLEEPLGLLSRQRLLYNRGLALGLLGRIEDAERTFDEVDAIATDTFDGRGSVLWCRSEVSFWSGRPERAADEADASLAYSAFNDAEYVLPALAAAWARLEAGRPVAPATIDSPFPMLAGAAPELAGVHALAAHRWHDAAAVLADAAARWAGHHRLRELLCRWAAADALRQAASPDGTSRLRTVLEEATAIGFEPLAARCRRSLRLAGERPAPASGANRTRGLLTPREREVLGLVARGLTNAEIARRMSLGRPTVARLLSNAMAKLGAESRAQAVALVGQPV